MMRFVVCYLSHLSFVFMLLSWNTEVAAEYMKLEVINIETVFVTQISLGTPPRKLSLDLDMTSDQVWFTCGVKEGQAMPPVPLPSKDTMPPSDPIPESVRLDLVYNLNPASNNFSYIFCDSPLCPNDLKNDTCNNVTLCAGSVDLVQDKYGVGVMYESIDGLNLNGHNSAFTFACVPFQSGLTPLIAVYHAAGVLGLGRGVQSFVSQLGFMYDNYFSYCLPSLDTESSGYFALGKENSNANNNPETIIYTPLIDDPLLYLIEITSVTINGTNVPIDSSESNTALDMGTFFTTLPPEAYLTMRKIVLAMNANTPVYDNNAYPNLPSDICFNTSSQGAGAVKIPSVEITFGSNATIVLDRSAIIYVVDSTMSCLGFNMWDGSDAQARFGGMQQAETDVLIDLGNGSVGFRQNTACATAN